MDPPTLLDNEYEFPRCEYFAGFEGTTAFKMDNPKFWGTYFRSSSDRCSEKLKCKHYNADITQSNPGTSTAVKSGTMLSPWFDRNYAGIFLNHVNHVRPSEYMEQPQPVPSLYDALLKYKLGICREVLECITKPPPVPGPSTSTQKLQLKAYVLRDYPCVMVHIPQFQKIKGEKRSLYKIAVAYFIAVVNKIACDYYVPIEMVHRSSFGHNRPSAAETSKSFRIDIGLVPKICASIISQALDAFSMEFLSFFTGLPGE